MARRRDDTFSRVVECVGIILMLTSTADAGARTWALMERARNGNRKGITGVPTGLAKIDREIAGLQAGDLDVIAARPNVGKTVLALHMARHAARKGYGVVFAPLEMTVEACMFRLIASTGEIDERAMRTGQEVDYAAAARVIAEMGDLPLMWMEEQRYGRYVPSRLTVDHLRDAVLERRKTSRVDVVFVDQLGHMKSTNTRDSRVWQISELCDGLKDLAMELHVAVVLCHQMNRDAESRDPNQNKRPELWHLKDSGRVEENSDVVILLHREGGAPRRGGGGAVAGGNVIEAAVAKNRRGLLVTTRLLYHAQQTRFEEMPG